MQEGRGRRKGEAEVGVGMRLWVSERRRKRVGIVEGAVGGVVIVGEGVSLGLDLDWVRLRGVGCPDRGGCQGWVRWKVGRNLGLVYIVGFKSVYLDELVCEGG